MPRLKLSEFLDKLFLLFSMLLFAWVGVRAIFEVRNLDSMAGQGRPLISELKVDAPRYEAMGPSAVSQTWVVPQSQSRGEDWVFDVFTPPVIYYDPSSREFAVTPPSLQPIDNSAAEWAKYEIELLGVRPRLYRLQLVGYAGEPGSYVATFEQTATGAILLVKEGETNPEAQVKLLSFQEEKIRTQREEDETPVLQDVGVARLHDLTTGQEVSLTNLETKLFSDLEARIRVKADRSIRLVRTGSRLAFPDGDYLIEDLSVDPEAAMIAKLSKDGTRRISKTLSPVSEAEPAPRSSRDATSPQDNPFSIRPSRPTNGPKN